MKIQFNTNTKADPAAIDRKKLVGEISNILNKPSKYLGMPTANYEVSDYTITKTGELLHDGALVNADNSDLLAQLEERGIKGEVIDRTGKYDAEPIPPREDDLDYGEAQHYPRHYANPDVPITAEMQKQLDDYADTLPPDRLIIEMPLDGFTPEKLDNLVKLVDAKATLLKAALGTSDLTIQTTATTVNFPWFSGDIDADRVNVYAMLISKICAAAKTKHRVIAKERDTSDNPKYAFRCWLLALGFIGEEYKAARKILLANLGGDGSWKSRNKANAGE